MEKGTLGYIDAYKKQYQLYAIGLAVMIVAAVVTVVLVFGTVQHVAIIIPAVLALPFANLLILWVIVAKFHSLNPEDGERIEERLGNRRNCIILYDMALSSSEAVSFASCLVIDQGNIYLLWGGSNDKKYGEEQQREYIQEIVNKTGYSYSVVTVHSVEELIGNIEAAVEAVEDLSANCNRLKQRMIDICV